MTFETFGTNKHVKTHFFNLQITSYIKPVAFFSIGLYKCSTNIKRLSVDVKRS